MQLACIRQIAGNLGGFQMLLRTLPRFKVLDVLQGRWIAHPLDRLVCRHKEHIPPLPHVVHEALKGLQVLRVPEPGRVKVEAIGRPVGGEMAVKVMHKHSVHILAVHIRRTTVHHATGVATAGLQLIHDHLPDARIAARRTVLVVARALVRHLKVERVGPEGWVGVRCDHGGVVLEAKLLHHEELAVPADAEEGHANAANLLHADVAKAVDDVRLADHFVEPVLDGGVVRPPRLGGAMTGKEEMGGFIYVMKD